METESFYELGLCATWLGMHIVPMPCTGRIKVAGACSLEDLLAGDRSANPFKSLFSQLTTIPPRLPYKLCSAISTATSFYLPKLSGPQHPHC